MADDDNGGRGRSWLGPNFSICSCFVAAILMAFLGREAFLGKAGPAGPRMRVSSLHVSNFSLSHSQLGGRYEVGFIMISPDQKMDVSLRQITVSIYHLRSQLARVREQEPITLERTRKNVKVRVVMKAHKVWKKKVVAELEKEWRRKKVVNFDVRVQVVVGVQAAHSPPKSKLFNLTCPHLPVFFSGKRRDSGRLVDNHDCHVNITE